jgi:hypothetical protein
VSDLNIGIVLQGLRNARRETLMAWCPAMVGSAPVETADHLLNALLDVELAIVAIEQHYDERDEEPCAPVEPAPSEPSEISGMVSALSSKARTT